jgi:hypothetical protein
MVSVRGVQENDIAITKKVQSRPKPEKESAIDRCHQTVRDEADRHAAFPSTPSISFGRAQNHLDLKEGVRSYSPARNAGLSLVGSSRITES